MKNKWIIGVGALVLLFAFVVGVLQSNPANSAPRLNAGEVESIVLEQYPGEVKDIVQTKSKKDAIYTVDLTYNGKEYAIQVDGNAGKIVHVKEVGSLVAADNEQHLSMLENSDGQQAEEKPGEVEEKPDEVEEKPEVTEPKDDEPKEPVKDEKPKQQDKPEEKPKDKPKQESKPKQEKDASKSSTILSAIEAIEIAQKEFPGVVLELERDKNNGRTIYEVELASSSEKAELEVDAMNGEIISIQVKSDKEEYRKYSGVALSMEEAIRIAQGKFQGTVIEVELDTNNGGFEYEVELVQNGKEAEIVIDGNTGEILEFDID